MGKTVLEEVWPKIVRWIGESEFTSPRDVEVHVKEGVH